MGDMMQGKIKQAIHFVREWTHKIWSGLWVQVLFDYQLGKCTVEANLLRGFGTQQLNEVDTSIKELEVGFSGL